MSLPKNDLNSKIWGVKITSSLFLIIWGLTCFRASASKTNGFLILLAKIFNSFPVSSLMPAPGPNKTASTFSAIYKFSSVCSVVK